ncbi:ComEA family DNA-binding protein [Streptomyces sp. NBC_01433]|uniref:ComEA family DNA-binding protein n=1 Tax=Streptomyces sp. NBC_01433 TaxID=2903864 RepID=UPI00224D038A|nr:ComEA family DNA-binding protein [Streptomyces sp. NBC_01433]MCX4677336.1 ComEA family DNA-binding protein [Streptomyces sp. NBC_01433]
MTSAPDELPGSAATEPGPLPSLPSASASTLPSGSGSVPASASAPVPITASALTTSVGAQGTGLSRRRRRLVLALRERLPLWLQLRCGLEPKTLAALAVVLVGAAVLAAVHFWSVRPQSVRAPEPVRAGEAAPAAAREPAPRPGSPAAPPGPSAGQPPAADPAGQIVVDVSGKVRMPGIRRLPAGSRVADALRAAGGVREGTDITGINRARVLMDGEQVVVGPVAVPSGSGTTGGGGPAAGPPSTPVSLNTATVDQLETLPGVGPVLAQHIVDYRAEHGGYRSVDELREVNGIGDRRFADLQPLVRP